MCDKPPRYLISTKCGKNMSVLARVRCGNFENANKYWLSENEKMCILCGKDWGTFDHYIEECERTIEWTENLPGEKYERLNKLIQGEENREIVNAIIVIETGIKNILEDFVSKTSRGVRMCDSIDCIKCKNKAV